MANKIPDRLFVRAKDIDSFRLLLKEKDSPFYKKNNQSVFLMAMVLGFHNKQRVTLDKKEEFVRMEYLSRNESNTERRKN